MEVHVLSNWIKQQEWKKTQLNTAKERKLPNRNGKYNKGTEQNWRTSKLEHEYEEETKHENRKLMEMEE